MWFYATVENYVNDYVNPRIKDIEDLKKSFVGLEAYIKTNREGMNCRAPLE